MRDIELSDKDRMLLANQLEILGLLKDDDHYIQQAETLRNGHKWLYNQFFDHIGPNLPDDDAEFVLRILGIYSDLRSSYENLTDKTGIEERQVEFPGFDGNNEIELLSFAKDLLKHGRFSDTLGSHVKNSHMPSREIYARMIRQWVDLGSPHYPYSKETIQKIIDARIHPSRR